ncbi:hypothetical protein GCM10027299_05870 [Larkinella ripae]
MPADRHEFLELLQRYMDGTCSSEEKQMMDYWYEMLDQDPKTGDSPQSQLEEKLWTRIQQRMQPEKATDPPLSFKWWPQND